MKKIILLAFLLISILDAKKCNCSNKMVVIFENSHEKVFELKNTIYKIIKNNGSDSVLMLLDEKSHKYITISSEISCSTPDTDIEDDDILELMQ